MNAAEGDDWARVAEVVRERMAELGLTQREAGASSTTVRALLNHHKPIKRRDALTALCEALGWTPNSIERILASKEPMLLSPSVDTDRLEALEARFEDLERRLEALIELFRPAAFEARRR